MLGQPWAYFKGRNTLWRHTSHCLQRLGHWLECMILNPSTHSWSSDFSASLHLSLGIHCIQRKAGNLLTSSVTIRFSRSLVGYLCKLSFNRTVLMLVQMLCVTLITLLQDSHLITDKVVWRQGSNCETRPITYIALLYLTIRHSTAEWGVVPSQSLPGKCRIGYDAACIWCIAWCNTLGWAV
jgi:hypothetical protein